MEDLSIMEISLSEAECVGLGLLMSFLFLPRSSSEESGDLG